MDELKEDIRGRCERKTCVHNDDGRCDMWSGICLYRPKKIKRQNKK